MGEPLQTGPHRAASHGKTPWWARHCIWRRPYPLRTSCGGITQDAVAVHPRATQCPPYEAQSRQVAMFHPGTPQASALTTYWIGISPRPFAFCNCLFIGGLAFLGICYGPYACRRITFGMCVIWGFSSIWVLSKSFRYLLKSFDSGECPHREVRLAKGRSR